MGEYSKHRDCPHFIVDVRDQPGVVLLDVEDNAIPNQIGVLARAPDGRKVSPGRANRFDDPNPGTKRSFPSRVLFLRGFNEMLAEDQHKAILAKC